MSMKRREFLAAGLALNIGSAIALAQGGATPDRARPLAVADDLHKRLEELIRRLRPAQAQLTSQI